LGRGRRAHEKGAEFVKNASGRRPNSLLEGDAQKKQMVVYRKEPFEGRRKTSTGKEKNQKKRPYLGQLRPSTSLAYQGSNFQGEESI